MKKLSKKAIFSVLLAIICTISVTALQATVFIKGKPAFENIDYSYTGDITPGKAEQIVKDMFGIADDTSVQSSILCVFGHSIQAGTIFTTQHNTHTVNPKCTETRTSVEHCKRSSCSHYAVISERSSRINCH